MKDWEDSHPPRQGEPVWAGAAGAFPLAHASSPDGRDSPSPPITAPLRTRLVEGAERSHACPAPQNENTAWPPAGAVGGSPRAWWMEGWEEEGGETWPYPTRRLLLRGPPFAVREAPPPGPPQPPCPRPPRPLLT